MAGAEEMRLDELIGGDGQGSHDVEVRAEVVEGAIGVAEDFDVNGSLADVLAVGFDLRSRRRSFNEDVVSHGAVRTVFSAWRNGGSAACKYYRHGSTRGDGKFPSHENNLPEKGVSSTQEFKG
jgi:hypothetical protein